jgi:plastocyanin
MSGNFFFVAGAVLVLAAVVLAVLGIRGSGSFPPSRPVQLGVTALFAAIVIGTMSFAIVKANQEQRDRRAKEASQEQQAQSEAATPPSPGGAASATLDVTSPADGSLVFDPNGLQAKPGNLTITYDNPSPISHSIAVATANGNVLGQVQPFANGKQSVTVSNLAPGKYIFFCTVPGHREAGMQGNLTVGAGG